MGRRFFIDEGKQTTNLASISLSKISKLPVPVPPAAEAREIIQRLARALEYQAEVAGILDGEASDAARLKQSILKSAFEGRLISQADVDRPVTTVLSRPSNEGTSVSRLRAKRTPQTR